MAKQFTLGKDERLKSRKLIEQLFREGKSISVFPFRVYYISHPITTDRSEPGRFHECIQFGVGVPAKNFKKAVDRNRIKRLTREAYRLLKRELQETLIENKKQLNLFFLYTAKELTDYKSIYDKIQIALQKMITEVEKRSAK